MIYRKFKDLQLSSLGLGCMRLPLIGSEQSDIDEAKTAEIVDFAIKNGINYFDTAWPYHSGNSETVIGKLLKAYPRDSIYLATKFPAFDVEKMKDAKTIFEKQLEKCCVDHFDFYLCHNVCERNIEWYLNPEFGVVEYLIQQKKNGRIRHFGFSTHGSRAVIQRFLDAYGDELEFCQIQLNYLDWKLQSAMEKVKLLERYNIPIWVMEPVRGGKLAQLSEDTMDKLNRLRPGTTAPEWAFRFLQSIGSVTMILSGMSTMDQLRENISTFCESNPLTEGEFCALMEIADEMIAQNAVPCTACGYCVDRCAQGIPIPDLIKAYNEKSKPASIGPESCIGCQNCESVCPQGIKIPRILERYSKILRQGD